MKNILDRVVDAAKHFVYVTGKYHDTAKVHGFYRLETPDGRLLGFHHNCPVSGDYAVVGGRGTVVTHCPAHVKDVFDPDAAMPVVVRRPRPGEAILPDGSRAVMTDAHEWGGEFEYEKSGPGFL